LASGLSGRWKTLVRGDLCWLEQMALHIGGLIKHAPALLAFTNPTILQAACSWFEAPVNLATQETALYPNSACSNPHGVPLSGSTANPIPLLRCCAGIDGIKNEIDPGEPGCGYLRTQPRRTG